MSINLITAINKLGYGTVGRKVLKGLIDKNIRVSLFPIGNVGFEENESKYVEEGLANATNYNPKDPTLKIWHQFDMSMSIAKGPKYGWPIFEMDRLTPKEEEELSSVRLINCSEWAREVCLKHGINSQVVPLGVDTDIFSPKPMPDKFTVFNCGKLEVRKGHDIIPDIINKAFPDGGIKLIMCWTNPFLDKQFHSEYESYYRKMMPDVEIVFQDRLNEQRDISRLINSSNCGLFPYRSEGWNLEGLEALACGRHLICTNYSGSTEYTSMMKTVVDPDGLCIAYDGIWFKGQGKWANIDNKIDEFAKHLQSCVGSGINQWGVDRAKMFTWDNTVRKLLEVIHVS